MRSKPAPATVLCVRTEGQVILNGSYNIDFTMDLACKDLGFATKFGQRFRRAIEARRPHRANLR